jgi:3-hydroxyisobutyrate dehydrogenase-like beta-hydroxyacid dehydrogenase
MARTDVPTTKLAINVDIADPAGVAVDAANSHRVVIGGASGIAAGTEPRRVLIRISNTSAGTPTVTIVRGPGAQDPAAADLVTTAIPATTGVRDIVVGTKYIQADGGIYLNITAGHTGVVQAFELPAGG